MLKLAYSLILITLILGCDSVIKKEDTALKSTYLDTTGLFENTRCEEEVRSFGLAEETLRNFLTEIINNENSIKKLVLIFYKEEGEVINLYKAGIVTYKDGVKVFYSLNNNDTEIVEIKSNNILNSLIGKIKELKTPTNRRMLIMEIDNQKWTCSIFKNIKAIETSGNKILF